MMYYDEILLTQIAKRHVHDTFPDYYANSFGVC